MKRSPSGPSYPVSDPACFLPNPKEMKSKSSTGFMITFRGRPTLNLINFNSYYVFVLTSICLTHYSSIIASSFSRSITPFVC